MLTTSSLQELLLDTLGYSNHVQNPEWEYRYIIPEINNVYQIHEVPVAYFSKLESHDQILTLYRKVWNESKAPILYACLPGEIRVYNTYATPPETNQDLNGDDRLLRHITRLVDIESARKVVREQLRDYERVRLDVGDFWKSTDAQKIKPELRADQYLLRLTDQVRRRLTGEGKLKSHVAYALIGRSLFIRYLEDRGVLTPRIIRDLTNGQADKYIDVLSRKDTTYTLFDTLNSQFAGDIFPVTNDERQGVTVEKHLSFLAEYLKGTDLDRNQPSFWPFNFEYIPIELISGVYDTFLNPKNQKSDGAYYTPLPLVEFVLNETLSNVSNLSNLTVLDPACGSGVFLVRAYQKIVASSIQRSKRRLSQQYLSNLLTKCVFGIDKQAEAVQIATFSLYLCMLGYLSVDQIRTFKLPSLHRNLVDSDFFDLDTLERLNHKKFDRIIGNPPWGKSSLKDHSSQWVVDNKWSIGNKQIAQAFLARAPELCAADGEIALIAPAKSTILSTSSTTQDFRKRLFRDNEVRAVVNFAAMRREMFIQSTSPCVAIFYRPSVSSNVVPPKLAYAVPKPSPLSKHLGAIVLDGSEIKYLDRETIEVNPYIWKVALWGTARDSSLIDKLVQFPTLDEQAKKRNWRVAGGITVGAKDRIKADWLQGYPILPTQKLKPYVLDQRDVTNIKTNLFKSPGKLDNYRAPLALIGHSPKKGKIIASISENDVAYWDTVTGIAVPKEDIPLLKWLVAFVNSPLATYFEFLTSTRWAVERDALIHKEIENLPFIIPEPDDPNFKLVIQLFDQLINAQTDSLVLRNQFSADFLERINTSMSTAIYNAYSITEAERQLIQDTVTFGIDFFYWSQRKNADYRHFLSTQPPSSQMLADYAQAFAQIVDVLLKHREKTVNAHIYRDSAPLTVIGLQIVDRRAKKNVQIKDDRSELDKLLKNLDGLLLDRQSESVYTRRYVRIYDDTWMYIVRPSESRFWTRTQAKVDADEALVEWLLF